MIRNILKDRRAALGLSLDAVGKAVGVNKSTVQRWESGGIDNVRQDKIVALANILQVTPNYILGLEDLPEEGKKKKPEPKRTVQQEEHHHLAVDISDLSLDQQREVLQFIAFIRSQKDKMI